MPEPVSSPTRAPNSSQYDPAECDPTRASCAAPVLTLEPVVIEGRPPRAAPSCEREHEAAALGCGLGAAALVVSTLGKTSILDVPRVVVSALREGAGCARLITAYDQCKEEGAARIAAANQCQADGGIAVAGVEKNEVVCLRQP
ncbi:MAG TPA: hypothetical protein VIW29_15070 [Polyangiaceae bacterium]